MKVLVKTIDPVGGKDGHIRLAKNNGDLSLSRLSDVMQYASFLDLL